MSAEGQVRARDVDEVHLDLGGYPVIVADTAGLRTAGGAIEAEGIARARKIAASADLVIALFDVTATPGCGPAGINRRQRRSPVWSKIDARNPHSRLPPPPLKGARGSPPFNRPCLPLAPSGGGKGKRGVSRLAIPISVKSGAGLEVLIEALTTRVRETLAETGAPPPTRARHREALARCAAALNAARTLSEPELTAEELRRAADELGRITGRIDIEEMLDSVFRDFCIGK